MNGETRPSNTYASPYDSAILLLTNPNESLKDQLDKLRTGKEYQILWPNESLKKQLYKLKKYQIFWYPKSPISRYDRAPVQTIWSAGNKIFIHPPTNALGEYVLSQKPSGLVEEMFFKHGHKLDPKDRPFAFRLSVLATKYVPKELPTSNLNRLISYNRAVSKLRSAVFLDPNIVNQFLENPINSDYVASTLFLAFNYGNRSFDTGDTHFAMMSLRTPKFTGKLLLDVSKVNFTITTLNPDDVGRTIRRELLKLEPYIKLMSEAKNDNISRGQAVAAAYAIVNKMKDDYALPRDADDHFATAYLLSIAPYISSADFNEETFRRMHTSTTLKKALFGKLDKNNPYAKVDLDNPYFLENIFTMQEYYMFNYFLSRALGKEFRPEHSFFDPRTMGAMGQRYDEIFGGEPGKGKHWLEYGIYGERSLYYLRIRNEIRGLLNKLRTNYIVAARLNAVAGLPPPEYPIVTPEDLDHLHKLMSDITIGRKSTKAALYTLLEIIGAISALSGTGGLVGIGLSAVAPRAAAAWNALPWYVSLPGEAAAGFATYGAIELFSTKHLPKAVKEAKKTYNELYRKRQTIPLLPEDFKRFQLLLNFIQNAALVPTLKELNNEVYGILPLIPQNTIPLSAKMRRSYLEALEEELREEEEEEQILKEFIEIPKRTKLKEWRLLELQEKMQRNPKTEESERRRRQNAKNYWSEGY